MGPELDINPEELLLVQEEQDGPDGVHELAGMMEEEPSTVLDEDVKT